jgi:hypothetical protein
LGPATPPHPDSSASVTSANYAPVFLLRVSSVRLHTYVPPPLYPAFLFKKDSKSYFLSLLSLSSGTLRLNRKKERVKDILHSPTTVSPHGFSQKLLRLLHLFKTFKLKFKKRKKEKEKSSNIWEAYLVD